MVLISIAPFAFRRLLLIVLALIGFSAVCFADPVLVARRYSSGHTGIVAARAVTTPAFDSTEGIEPSWPWNAVVAWDKAEPRGRRSNSIWLGTWSWEWETGTLAR